MKELGRWFLLGALTLVLSCEDRPNPGPAGGPDGLAPERTPKPLPPAPEPVPRPWFEGRWTAEVMLMPQPSALEAGAAREATDVDSAKKEPPMPQELTLSIDGQGNAQGTLAGLTVTGQIDGDVLRARATDRRRSGVLIADKSAQGLSATLKFSSGDSMSVFAADFLMRKAPDRAP